MIDKSMKVIKDAETIPLKYVTMQLGADVIAKADEVAKKAKIPRQTLIDSILWQALNDRNFVLKVRKR